MDAKKAVNAHSKPRRSQRINGLSAPVTEGETGPGACPSLRSLALLSLRVQSSHKMLSSGQCWGAGNKALQCISWSTPYLPAPFLELRMFVQGDSALELRSRWRISATQDLSGSKSGVASRTPGAWQVLRPLEPRPHCSWHVERLRLRIHWQRPGRSRDPFGRGGARGGRGWGWLRMNGCHCFGELLHD